METYLPVVWGFSFQVAVRKRQQMQTKGQFELKEVSIIVAG